MATYQSKHAVGQKPVASLNDSLGSVIPFEYVTTAALAAGDIIVMGPIESNLLPLDVALVTDDLDTNGSPTVTLSVGILNAGQTDLDTTFIAASTAGQTGGVARATTANTYLSGRSTSTRWLGVKVVAAPATNAAVGKKLAVLLTAAG